jgi:hypothetical protein
LIALTFFINAAMAFVEASSIPNPAKNLSFFNATEPKFQIIFQARYGASIPFATSDLVREHIQRHHSIF